MDTGQIVTIVLAVIGLVSTGYGVLFRALIQSHRDAIAQIVKSHEIQMKAQGEETERWRTATREWQDRAWLAVSDVVRPAVQAVREQR